MSVTEILARFVAEAGYDQLPPEAVTAARRAVLDTVGVALAGSREECGRIAASLAAEEGGAPEAAVLGAALRLPATRAALVNGVFAHALDYDDVHVSMKGHPSAPLLPAVLALAEKLERGGRAVIEAFVLGIEVECRVGRGLGPSHYDHGWHATATLGTLGAAAAAGKLLGLDVDGLRRSLGIATSLASGSRQNFGTMTKPLHAGEAARSGLLAAQLAARGFSADADILDSPAGFGGLFAPEGDWCPERVVEGLGRSWEIVSPGIGVKAYPCCYVTHRALDAVLDLTKAHDIRPQDLERLQVVMPRGASTPLIHSRPRTGLEGKFSMEYCLTTALLDGAPRLATFSDEAVRRTQAQDLLRRVVMKEGVGKVTSVVDGYAEVELVLRDGSSLRARVDHPRGLPEAPLSWDELVDKYVDCARGVLSHDAIERSLDLIGRLEALHDVGDLMGTLSFGVE